MFGRADMIKVLKVEYWRGDICPQREREREREREGARELQATI